MVKDLVPELLDEIREEFDKGVLDSSVLESLLAKLAKGKANYLDANDYAVELGEILSKALRGSVTASKLPDGKMYFNIAKRVLEDVLGTNYDKISEYSGQVQDILNGEAKIMVAVQRPNLNQDRIDGIINRLDSEPDFDSVSWILGDPIVNFSQSIVDDFIRANAEFNFKSGLHPKITRTIVGKPCKWCKSLAGSYDYPDVPDDVYKRHSNCRCTVDYHPGSGRRQNVHSKKWSAEKKAAAERRKTVGLVEDEKPYQSVKKEWLKHSGKGSVSDMAYWEHDGIKYRVDGKHVVLDYSQKEKKVAEWLANKFGAKVEMAPRVNLPDKIPSPDYLVNGLKFDLKEITGSGKGTIDQNTRKAKTQAENIIYDVSKSPLTDEDVEKQLADIYKRGRRGLDIAVIKRNNRLVDIIRKRN